MSNLMKIGIGHLALLFIFFTSCQSEIDLTLSNSDKKSPQDLLTLELSADGSGTNIHNRTFDISDKVSFFTVKRTQDGNFSENVEVTWLLNGSIGTLVVAVDGKSAEFTATTGGKGEIIITTDSFTKTVPISVSNPEAVTVSAMYPNFGQNWFDHVRNNSNDYYSAADTSDCNTLDTEIYHCLHGGQMRKVRLDSTNSCNNLTAQDSLGVFDWYCIEKVDHVLFVSKLKNKKGLSDLINGSNWRDNSVTVNSGIFEIAKSNSSTWWSDTIYPAPINSSNITEINTSGIFVIENNQTTGGYRITTDNVALIGNGSSPIELTYNAGSDQCNSTGGSGSTHACMISIPSGRQNIWIENFKFLNMTSVDLPLYTNSLVKGHIRKIHIDAADAHSFNIAGGGGSKFLWIDDISALGATGVNRGMTFDSSVSAARISNIKVYNKHDAIVFNGADNIIFGPATISSNTGEGIISSSSSLGNTIYNVNVNNNVGAMSNSGSASNHDFTIIQSQFTNNNRGSSGAILTSGAGNIVFGHNVVANNTDDGMYTNSGTYMMVLSNTLFLNNNGSGFEGANTTRQRWHNIGAFNNNQYGIGSYWSTDVILTGQLIFGGNGSSNCGAFSGSTGVSSNCTSTGADNSNTYNSGPHTAIYRRDRDVKLAFVGIAGDDSINATAGINADSRITSTSITDWFDFENHYRAFSLMGASSDFLTTDERGFCDSGSLVNCDILDFSLLNATNTSNPVLLNQSGNFTTSDNQYNETFVANQDCPSAVHGDQTLSDEFTTPRFFLPQAIEILDDGYGDDNGLCNSNERCIYAPNIGRYQGHGDYLSNGICNFQDGVTGNAVTGVIMYAYPNNGY